MTLFQLNLTVSIEVRLSRGSVRIYSTEDLGTHLYHLAFTWPSDIDKTKEEAND